MKIESVPGLVVRPADDTDLPLIQAICAEIWGGHDYVPYVWKEWGQHPGSQRYILELDGQAVGSYCLRMEIAGPNSAWVQGVRVDPKVRKRGIAGGLLEHAITASREQGKTVIRYTTAEENTAMHRLAERFGFSHIGTYLIYDYLAKGEGTENSSIPRETPAGLRAVEPSEFAEVWRVITNSPEYLTSHEFYCYDWRWSLLTPERVQQHLREKEFYTFDAPGQLQTLLLRVFFMEADRVVPAYPCYRVAGMYGENIAERVRLLQTFAQFAVSQTVAGKTVAYDGQVIRTPGNEQALKEAGFVPNHEEPVMFLYEKFL